MDTVCHVCTEHIHSFGLLCPLCMCAVHLNCYDSPVGSTLTQYEATGASKGEEGGMQKVVVARFGKVGPLQLGEIEGLDGFRRIVKEGHHLVLVSRNLPRVMYDRRTTNLMRSIGQFVYTYNMFCLSTAAVGMYITGDGMLSVPPVRSVPHLSRESTETRGLPFKF